MSISVEEYCRDDDLFATMVGIMFSMDDYLCAESLARTVAVSFTSPPGVNKIDGLSPGSITDAPSGQLGPAK